MAWTLNFFMVIIRNMIQIIICVFMLTWLVGCENLQPDSKSAVIKSEGKGAAAKTSGIAAIPDDIYYLCWREFDLKKRSV
jgi:hypothetical protein